MKRIVLLLTVAVGCLTAAFRPNPPRPTLAARQDSRPPNVLFIICDDLNDYIQGWDGHPQVITPNLARLGKRTTRFLNAHSNHPLCGPSRASMLTGIYPHVSSYYGHRQSNFSWRKAPAMEKAVTMIEHFANNGYGVYGVGKIFHDNIDTESLFRKAPAGGDFAWRSSMGPFPWNGKAPVAHPDLASPLGESTYMESFGPLTNLRQRFEEGNQTKAREWRTTGSQVFDYESEDRRSLLPDEACAEWAGTQLARSHDKPFLLMVGFNKPHRPLHLPQKYFDRYPLDKLQLPPIKPGDTTDFAPEFRRHAVELGRLEKAYGKQGLKRWLQAYLASITFLDEQVGKVLDALSRSAYADNTLVIFTSDHGFHHGEKGWYGKVTLWEESTRVPLLVGLPGQKRPATCRVPVSLIDLYPTLIDLCRLPPNPNQKGNQYALNGSSFAPWVAKPTLPDNGRVVLTSLQSREENDPVLNTSVLRPANEQHFALRTQHYRYIRTNRGNEELYDHRTDPNEWTNRAQDPKLASVKRQLQTQLTQLLQ